MVVVFPNPSCRTEYVEVKMDLEMEIHTVLNNSLERKKEQERKRVGVTLHYYTP